MNSYLGELRVHWRPLLSVVLGLSSGLVLTSFVIGIMGNYLVAEFKWPKEQMAIVGVLALGAVLLFPLVGRMADVHGVRKTAMIGVISSPIIYLALSRIETLAAYAALYALQLSVLATTTPPVYCRIIVQYFEQARGLALGIATAGPAVTVAIGGPILNNFVTDHGWRVGYVVVAVFTGLVGIIGLLMLPPEQQGGQTTLTRPKTARKDYARIFRSRVFWILIVGILLCNLPQWVIMSQLGLILAENGASGKDASIMVSALAGGTMAGRLISGLALDRFPASWIATISLAISGFGLIVIASDFDARLALFLSILLFGMSIGAESDVFAYIVVRNFGVKIYSSVHSILATSTTIATVLGSVILSLSLSRFGLYWQFLGGTGALVVVASFLFLLIPKNPEFEDDLVELETQVT